MYGAVGFFFFARWVRLRKLPSLYLALSAPLGWVALALWDLGLTAPLPWAPARWVGAAVGLLMLTSVVRWDKVDPPKR